MLRLRLRLSFLAGAFLKRPLKGGKGGVLPPRFWGGRCKLAQFGGNWNNGANAGLFFWNLNNTSSNANVTIGGRLVKKKV